MKAMMHISEKGSMRTVNRFTFAKIAAACAALLMLSLAVAAVCSTGCMQAYADSYSASSAEFADLSGQTVASSAEDAAKNHVHVYDRASLLSDSDESSLSAQITQMIGEYGLDIVIFTDTTTHGCSSRGLYAADFYERNHYGIGSDINGMVFFICMEQGNRGWYTAATGACTSRVDSAAVNYVDDAIESAMQDHDFGRAAARYLDNWDGIFSGRINPSGSRSGSDSFDASDAAWSLGISAIFGVLVGWVCLKRKRRQMETIAIAQEASTYMVAHSLRLSDQDDRYVTTTVVRTPKPRNDHRGGPGKSDFGGFTSSGGTGFSGGGRSF